MLVLVLAAAAAAAFFYYRPAPSCFDGKQNQNETGIDCGGACQAVCRDEILALKPLWTRVLKLGDSFYDSVTLVENPNLNLGIKKLSYVIKFLDSDNRLITERAGQTFVNPNESFAIFENQIEVGERVPARAFFELAPEKPVWQRVSTADRPDLDVEEGVFVNEPTPSLRAKIINRSTRPVAAVDVVAILEDAEKNTIGASATRVDALPPGESRELVFTWPAPFDPPPVFHEFYPHFSLVDLD